jgi:hypothetical protein
MKVFRATLSLSLAALARPRQRKHWEQRNLRRACSLDRSLSLVALARPRQRKHWEQRNLRRACSLDRFCTLAHTLPDIIQEEMKVIKGFLLPNLFGRLSTFAVVGASRSTACSILGVLPSA